MRATRAGRRRPAVTMLLAGAAAAMSAALASAQPPPGGGPPGGGPSGPGKSFTKEAPAGEHSPGGPRDISGTWTMRQFSHLGAYDLKPEWRGRVAGPVGMGAPADKLTLLCVPVSPFEGGGYPVQIVQTPGQVTIIAEENHRYRRILLDKPLPKVLAPRYLGYSVGHWDGDTLVVETVGLRRLYGVTPPPDLKVTEHFTKSVDGRVLENRIEYDSPALVHPQMLSESYNWRPDVHLQESICEEFSDPFGAGYNK